MALVASKHAALEMVTRPSAVRTLHHTIIADGTTTAKHTTIGHN